MSPYHHIKLDLWKGQMADVNVRYVTDTPHLATYEVRHVVVTPVVYRRVRRLGIAKLRDESDKSMNITSHAH